MSISGNAISSCWLKGDVPLESRDAVRFAATSRCQLDVFSVQPVGRLWISADVYELVGELGCSCSQGETSSEVAFAEPPMSG